MKSLAIRAAVFGITCSIGAGVVTGAIARLAVAIHAPSFLSWPFLLYYIGCVPEQLVLSLFTDHDNIFQALFHNGGPFSVFALVASEACFTWAMVIAIWRFLWLRKREASNYSFKPTSLRDAA